MAARTTAALVAGILGDNYDSRIVLTPFIDTATALTDSIESADTGNALSDSMLAIIERYLAAHYYTLADPLYISRSTGGASGSFPQRSYWDEAKKLDSTGYLAKLDLPTRPKAGASWLGKPPSEQTDYRDRD